MNAATLTRDGETPFTATRSASDDDQQGARRPRLAIVGLALAVATLLAAGLLVAGPARGMRADIARQRVDVHAQRALITAQRDITAQQLALTEQQLTLTQHQLDITTQQLSEARTTREISQRTQDLAAQQLELTKETIRLQQQLLAIANETLQHVRNIDAKTPTAPAAATGVVNR